MTITYPISLPIMPGMMRWRLSAENAIGLNTSPFNFSEQVYAWPGARWRADFTLPPTLKTTPNLANALNSNPNANLIGLWQTASGSGALATIGDGKTGTSTLRSTTSSAWNVFNNPSIAIDHAKQYRIRAWYRKNAAGNGTFYLVVQLYDSSGLNIGGDGTYWFYPVLGAAGSTSWTQGSGVFGAGTARPFPSNARSMRAGLLLNEGGSAGYFEAQDIYLSEAYNWTARDWIAAMVSLRGRFGSFLIGDPGMRVPRGAATGTPLVNGGSQTGSALITDGWTANIVGILKAGDFFQLGSGSTSRLYMNLTDVNSNDSGQATLDIFPPIPPGSSPSDNAPLTVTDPKGVFRLDRDFEWGVDNIPAYGINFSAHSAV